MTTPDFAAAHEAGTDRKKIVLVGGLVAALLAGGGGYLLLSGGEDDLALGVPPAARPLTPAKAAPAKAATPAKKPAAKIPAPTTVRLGRDPFLALYVQPVAAAPAPGTGTSTGTGTDTTGGTATGGGTSTPTVTSAPYALTLQSVTGSGDESRLYTFNVGGSKKTVVQGQKFGKYGELVTLAYIRNAKGAVTGALIQVGDDDPITIKLGEKLTVL